MKTLITISIFLFIPTFSNAQYQSLFGEESTSWNMSVAATGIFAPPISDSCFVLNDTIINGLNYSRISHNYFQYSVPNQSSGFIREDTVSGKVWYLFEYSNEEFLIMDMSLEVNDTFLVNHLNYSEWHYVDSIYISEGRKHIIFDLEIHPYSLDGEKFTMIEGVGTNLGFLYQNPFYNSFFEIYLLCQTKDDSLAYTNNSPYFEGKCDVDAVAVEESTVSPELFTISPNPANAYFVIQSGIPGVTKAEINIYNHLGQNIFHNKKIDLFTDRSSEINLSEFKSGLYFILIKSGHFIQTKKLIVEKPFYEFV